METHTDEPRCHHRVSASYNTMVALACLLVLATTIFLPLSNMIRNPRWEVTALGTAGVQEEEKNTSAGVLIL